MRLDQALVFKNVYPTRAKAVAAIKAGLVVVNGVVATKPSQAVADTDDVAGGALPYVSGRGSLKLVRALGYFGVNPAGCMCLDVGASTGGFTEVLLARGARGVVAVDVGTNQLIPELRADVRVKSLEQTDIRSLVPICSVDLIVVDVSFVSLLDILSALQKWDSSKIIVLIKPQFEVLRNIAAKMNGVIKSAELRDGAIQKVVQGFGGAGYLSRGVIESPIRGGSGNIEYLAYFTR